MRFPIPFALAVSLLGLGALMVCPARAAAGCGDYVVYTNPAHGQPMADHPPAPVKCQGPNCSQAPAPAPMPQVPPTVRSVSDQSLPLVGGDGPDSPDTFWHPFDPAGGSPVRRATAVYHPPR